MFGIISSPAKEGSSLDWRATARQRHKPRSSTRSAPRPSRRTPGWFLAQGSSSTKTPAMLPHGMRATRTWGTYGRSCGAWTSD